VIYIEPTLPIGADIAPIPLTFEGTKPFCSGREIEDSSKVSKVNRI